MRSAAAAVVLALLLGSSTLSCSKLFPPPERPRKDGYSATLQGTRGGHSFELAVAVAPDRERRDFGNPGRRRSLIIRRDLGQAWELDEGTETAYVRPLAEGEQLFPSNGFYPFEPIPLRERHFDQLAPLYHEGGPYAISFRQLSDAGIGLHPCDVERIDRSRADGSGFGETWYIARDLDGLVIRREVKAFAEGKYAEAVESEELVGVRFPVDPDRFEIPKEWRVEHRADATPILASLPAATPVEAPAEAPAEN